MTVADSMPHRLTNSSFVYRPANRSVSTSRMQSLGKDRPKNFPNPQRNALFVPYHPELPGNPCKVHPAFQVSHRFSTGARAVFFSLSLSPDRCFGDFYQRDRSSVADHFRGALVRDSVRRQIDFHSTEVAHERFFRRFGAHCRHDE